MIFSRRKPRPVASDKIGPDKPRVLLGAVVLRHDAHGMDPDSLWVVLQFLGCGEISISVARSTAARLPVGRTVYFVLEDARESA